MNDKLPYEAPVIIYEGVLTTRAGSTGPKVGDYNVNPENLFGSSQ